MMGTLTKPAIALAECLPCGIRILVSGSPKSYAEQADFILRHIQCEDRA